MVRKSCRSGDVFGWIIAFIIGVLILGYFFLSSIKFPQTAVNLQQRAQFHAIEVGLELFKEEYGYYVPSNDNSLPPVNSGDPTPYCGANKLAEAMAGSDFMGFHPESAFRSDGQTVDASGANKELYTQESIDHRNDRFIELEKSNAYKLSDIYKASSLESAGLDPDSFVLCDSFAKRRHSGMKTGMPILYYRADITKKGHNIDDPDSPDNIYNYKDNLKLLSLGVPGKSREIHPLFKDSRLFYEITRIEQATTVSIPFHAEKFILISAGKDGLYGTEDDVYNFSKEE